MKNLPNIFKFLALFMTCYIILSLLPSVKPIRTVAVSTYGTFQQVVLNMFHPTAKTDFKNYEGASTEYDYSIYIYLKEAWKRSTNKRLLQPSFILNQNARLTAFGPFIMLLSLIIASPIPWTRKLISLCAGAFLIFVLLGMKYSAMFDQNAEILRPEGFSAWISLSKVFNNAFRTQEFLALLIIPIWAISSFRGKDWKWFLQ